MRRRISARSQGSVRRVASLVAVGAVVAAGACVRPPLRTLNLERFATCDALVKYFKDAALARVGPYGLGQPVYIRVPVGPGGPMPPVAQPGSPGSDHSGTGGGDGSAPRPAVPDHSDTNVQEAGVDEPDIVKNDGRRLLTVINNSLHIIDLTGAAPRVAGTLAVPGGSQLLMQGDRVLVISSLYAYGMRPVPGRPVTGGPAVGAPIGGIMPPYYPSVPRTRLMLADISDASKPKKLDDRVVDGGYVDARLVGGRARVVTSASVRPLPFVYPSDGTDAAMRLAQRTNEDVIRRTTATDWLPRVSATADGTDGRDLLPCDRVAHPGAFSGFNTVAVLSLNLAGAGLDTADTTGVVADGQNVYASTKNLYVATRATTDTGYTGRLPDTGSKPAPSGDGQPVYEPRTSVHAFDVSTAGAAAYRASGTVEGAPLSQWSFSEYEGYLRVVTTLGTTCGSCAGQQAQLSVLRLGGAQLPVVGTVAGMGKGESVRSVRFIGDRGYVVTFRQVDPFYVLDLHEPTRPVVAGELKTPGYSAYLHPVGDHQLLGVGRDATAEGRVTGTKVSLYDVADPTRPAEVRSIVLPDAYTSVEQTAKAFLWWDPQRLAVVPVTTWSPVFDGEGKPIAPGFTGAIGLDVGTGRMTERGRVTNGTDAAGSPEIIRSAVAGDRLLTVSWNGVRTSDLTTLAPRSWLEFPALVPPPSS